MIRLWSRYLHRIDPLPGLPPFSKYENRGRRQANRAKKDIPALVLTLISGSYFVPVVYLALFVVCFGGCNFIDSCHAHDRGDRSNLWVFCKNDVNFYL